MSIPYERTGRTKQKLRTRDAIIEAARGLMAGGTEPTVEQAADAAGVSRATAYRYFTNKHDLLSAVVGPLDAPSLLDDAVGDSPEERLRAVVERITDVVITNEAGLRAMLRLSLEQTHQPEIRGGRRIRWVDDALKPIAKRMRPTEYKRLVRAIAATIGIEAYVWMRDVADLSSKEAVDLMQWSAASLLRSALSSS
jgi:AcrR family transcriptional regulator